MATIDDVIRLHQPAAGSMEDLDRAHVILKRNAAASEQAASNIIDVETKLARVIVLLERLVEIEEGRLVSEQMMNSLAMSLMPGAEPDGASDVDASAIDWFRTPSGRIVVHVPGGEGPREPTPAEAMALRAIGAYGRPR